MISFASGLTASPVRVGLLNGSCTIRSAQQVGAGGEALGLLQRQAVEVAARG